MRGPEVSVPLSHTDALFRYAMASSDGFPHPDYVSKLEVAQVREAIQQLPPEFREIIILREYDELFYDEIAEILRCPAGTVMSRLARARSRLRTVLSMSPASSFSPAWTGR
jgi:RNA polymerase sigma-70 factor, ECF subfamily